MMKKKFLLGVVALSAALCLSAGMATVVNPSMTAGAEEPVLDLLDSGATFDNSNANLQYDVAKKTGSASVPTGVSTKYFTYTTKEYVATAEGKKKFEGFSAEYSVKYTEIGTPDQKADTNYVGAFFKVDGYSIEYRVGGAMNYGGSDYLKLGTDTASPFAASATGNKRNLKSVVMSAENPTATIVFKFTPKKGDVNGSYSITVNGESAGSYDYASTKLPEFGLYVGKNSAKISDASIKIEGATGWWIEEFDMLSVSGLNHSVVSDGATAAENFSYDFASKVGYIGGSESGVGVAEKERATAYFKIDAPDKVIDSDDNIVDYSSVDTVTVSMTYSNVVAADGTFDANNNTEFVAIRLNDPESSQKAGFFVMPAQIYTYFGVIERSKTDSTSVYAPETSGNIRFCKSTSPWNDGAITITLKIVAAHGETAGSIEVLLNGISQETIAYTSEAIPEFAMYSRGVSAKVTDVSYNLSGITDIHTHTEETLEAVAKSCTTDGLTEGKRCSVCGMILVQQEVIPASHELTKVEAVVPTCTTGGNVEHWKCGVCEKTFSDESGENEITETALPASGHLATKTEAVAPTCTESGNVEFWFCESCSKIFSDESCETEIFEVTVPATGHMRAVKTEGVAATCTESGNIEYWTCESCGKIFSDEECTSEITETAVPAAGHSAVKTEGVAATCTESGNVEYWTCENCGKIFSDEECTSEITETAVPATGHTAGEWIVDREAQVGVKGSKHKECTVCGETLETEEIPALEDTDPGKDPDPSTDGNEKKGSSGCGGSIGGGLPIGMALICIGAIAVLGKRKRD